MQIARIDDVAVDEKDMLGRASVMPNVAIPLLNICLRERLRVRFINMKVVPEGDGKGRSRTSPNLAVQRDWAVTLRCGRSAQEGASRREWIVPLVETRKIKIAWHP
tara:strand:+ start:72 stop:389 length:318 start_codon:yes stop_codon:yes gene_type:complete